MVSCGTPPGGAAGTLPQRYWICLRSSPAGEMARICFSMERDLRFVLLHFLLHLLGCRGVRHHVTHVYGLFGNLVLGPRAFGIEDHRLAIFGSHFHDMPNRGLK